MRSERLACGALAVWAQPLWVLHWHHLLEHGTHYVAAADASDAARVAKWYAARPTCAHAVGRAGAALVGRYLTPHATRCYWATLLRGYARKMPSRRLPANSPTIDEYLMQA